MIHRVFSLATLSCLLLAFVSFPKNTSDALRSTVASSLSPIWTLAHGLRSYVQDRPFFTKTSCPSLNEERLQIEMVRLKGELALLEKGEGRLSKQDLEPLQNFFDRQFSSTLAPVVYRDPSSWSSSMWIQLGEKDNREKVVIGKNSPVVLGSCLVGVVEFVGECQSKVRLITDSELTVSVRALRGQTHDQRLALLAKSLFLRIESREDLFLDPSTKKMFLRELKRLEEISSQEDGFFAKGHLLGSSAPFWRSRHPQLQGVGFNYDYADEKGPARDLRSGSPIGCSGKKIPILKEGDLLVTSGLDGIFPLGIEVAVVEKVFPLEEGAFSYDLRAKPLAANVEGLEHVFVLPPL